MKRLQTDVLVVGSGLAGTLFALELAKKRKDVRILLLNKKEKAQSASYLAQGGIAAALPGASDSMKKHLADTMIAGAGKCNPITAAWFVSKAPDAIRTLEQWGTSFDCLADGSRALALEGGHSRKRILHHKDRTGRHILEHLHTKIEYYPNISLLEDVQVLELIQPVSPGPVAGAWAWDSGEEKTISIGAKAVVLATGGLGSLYAYSTNPATAMGEGISLAAKAGARVQDLAYVQFHPTALWQASGARLALISEALRGAGAMLRNEAGIRFMEEEHPLKELAPRDIVSRMITTEIARQQKPYVYLDATSLPEPEWEHHFPGIFQLCDQAGIDPRKQWIPVVPAAHYSCGGIATSVKGSTSVERLFVIGESACTGLHGANRLASNSLLEATLMAAELAKEIARKGLGAFPPVISALPELHYSRALDEQATALLQQLRKSVQEGGGIIKSRKGLLKAYLQLQELQERIEETLPEKSLQAHQLKMALHTAMMLFRSCLEQTENRGGYFNTTLENHAMEAYS